MVKTVIGVIALVALTTSLAAQDKKPAGSLTDVTGVWVMLVAGHQIGLELDQKGTVVEGVILRSHADLERREA